MGKWSTLIGCAALTMSVTAPAASIASNEGRANLSQKLLALHNQARAEVGAPPLMWDERLAQSAAAYGPDLARGGRLVHSPRETRPGQRENLAMGWTQSTSAEELVGLWTDEKRMMTPGLFPAVSRTGYWKDVAHYTQMVWKSTTHVGCAVHSDQRGWSYLICRYSPPGNVDGKPVF